MYSNIAVCEHYYSYGGERYEKRDMQVRVRQRFSQLQTQDEREGNVPWHIVNAAQSIEEVQAEINQIVERTVSQVNKEAKPLQVLWQSEANEKEN